MSPCDTSRTTTSRPEKRKPRKLGGAKDAEICRRYEAGEGVLKISAEFGINKTTVHRVLKRAGIAPNRRLSDADTCAIRRRYESGEAGGSIAKDFGVSKEAIYRVLDKLGVARRPWHGPLPTLGPSQVDEAARRYTGRDTCKAIAQDFDVSATCVVESLRRNGVQIRRRGTPKGGTRPYLWVLSPEEHLEICSRYREGVSCEALAREYEVSASGVASEPLSPQQKADACRRYLAGEQPKEISKATGVGLSTISFVLARNDVQPRYKIRYIPEQESEAYGRYSTGDKIANISRALGLSPGGVYQILSRRGVDPSRTPRRLEWEETEAAKVIRGLPAYRKWRLAALKSDKRACHDCGAHSTTENPLHVHHLQSFAEILAEYRPISVEQAEGYSAFWDVDNGITLCADCHREAHADGSHTP